MVLSMGTLVLFAVAFAVVSALHRLCLKYFEEYICLTSALSAFFLALLSWFLLNFMVSGWFGSRSIKGMSGGEYCKKWKEMCHRQLGSSACKKIAKDNGRGRDKIKN
jgi:hypothetical protein